MTDTPIISIDAIPDMPDFFGVTGRVQTVCDLLENAQGQLQHFQALRLVNGHDLTHPLPVPDNPDGLDYQTRFRQLAEGISALLEANQDIRDEITAEALKRRKKREQD